VFERDRLAERQLVIAPENKVVLREIYDGQGNIRLMDEAGNELQESALPLADVSEPNLHPDTKRLVVLPLPLRSRQHVLASLDLDPAHNLHEAANACYRYLSPDAALQLLASLYAEGNAYEAFLVVRDCFLAHGDSRPGLFALLLASGFEPDADAECFAAMKTQVDQPIVRYVILHGNGLYHTLQKCWPLNWATAVGKPDSFLRRLAEFDDLTWRDPQYVSPFFRARARLVDRARYADFITRNSKNVLGWALLNHVQDRRIPYDTGSVPEPWLWAAQQWDLIAGALGKDSNARYERAICLLSAGRRDEARTLFLELYREDLKAGVLPPIEYRFRSALESDATRPDLWNPLILKTAEELLKEDNRAAVIALASQCQQLRDEPLAENLLRQALAGLDADDGLRQQLITLDAFRALKDTDKETVLSSVKLDRLARVTLQAVAYYRRLSNTARAEELLDALLARKEFTRSPGLWRLASTIANDRGSAEKSIQCLERALDLEFANLPPVINLDSWRADHGRLLNHYLAVVNAAGEQHRSPPGDIAHRTIRAVDRWRKHDPEATGACRTASEILYLLGAREIAWEYLTTAEGNEPTTSRTWDDLGQRMQRRGEFGTADMAYATAFEADPNDATILWKRSENLRQAGDVAGADKLLRQIADSEWQPAYNNVRANARWQLQQR
jgi:predicted Zn-dependent protease